MTNSLRLLTAGILATAALASAPAQAADSPWMVRVRAIWIDPADKSDANAGADLPADVIDVESKVAPDIDIEYFFTPNWSAELLLTIPQKHDVEIEGAGEIGSFKHLPPTLTVKYNFLPESAFRPYVGVGVNYTRIWDVDLLGGIADLDKDSFGFAAQVGFDYKVTDQWFASFDAKWINIEADVKAGGARLTTVKVDPLVIGVGVGYRF
jgi:outer membrane protein